MPALVSYLFSLTRSQVVLRWKEFRSYEGAPDTPIRHYDCSWSRVRQLAKSTRLRTLLEEHWELCYGDPCQRTAQL